MKKIIPFLNSYKQHNQLLLILFVLFGILIYQINIKKTFALKKETKQLSIQIERAENALPKLEVYRQQLKRMEAQSLQPYDRGTLLSNVTRFCKDNHLLIRHFPESSRTETGSYIVVTSELEVEGTFKNLLRLNHMLEQEKRLGTIASLHFFIERDRLTKKDYLKARTILKAIEEK